MELENAAGMSAWYDTVDAKEKLQQGDFVDDCPFVTPLIDMEPGSVKVRDFEVLDNDVIIVSHSCDLVNEKLPFVLVCPVYSLSEFESSQSFFRGNVGKELLRRGISPAYYMLNECHIDEFQRGYSVVSFRDLYTVPYDVIKELANRDEKRLRLLTPYREQLSQAFGKFFMRIGLPTDIGSFANLSSMMSRMNAE